MYHLKHFLLSAEKNKNDTEIAIAAVADSHDFSDLFAQPESKTSTQQHTFGMAPGGTISCTSESSIWIVPPEVSKLREPSSRKSDRRRSKSSRPILDSVKV